MNTKFIFGKKIILKYNIYILLQIPRKQVIFKNIKIYIFINLENNVFLEKRF